MQIAIGNTIGYPSNAGKAAGIFAYLLNDTFTTDRAAGAVNGTKAEPGPGLRDVNDTGSKLSLSSGSLVIATAAPGTGNPRLLYAAQGRRAGLVAIIALTTPASGVAGPARVGWTYNPTGIYGTEAVAFASSNVLEARVNLTNVTVGASALGTSYIVAVVLRASGAFYFLKGGAFTNWTMLWSSSGVVDTPMAPVVAAINNGAGCSSAYLRVPATLWLPTPLVSDGFGTAWGTSDGLGHSEGVAGGLGAGGGSLGWTQNVGAWSVSGGAAAASLTGGRAIATIDCGKADVVVTAKLTGGANSAAILARYVTESDYVELRHTGSNVQLVKVVGTVNTTLINSAVTFVAGAEIRLICEGQKFRAYYNNVLVGTEQTIADASLASGTLVGLRSANASNIFDDFVVRARGTGGEYAALDNF